MYEDRDGNCRARPPRPCAADEFFAGSALTEWLCPECHREGDAIAVRYTESGVYACRECGERWTEPELARSYAALLADLLEKLEEAGTPAMNRSPFTP